MLFNAVAPSGFKCLGFRGSGSRPGLGGDDGPAAFAALWKLQIASDVAKP